MYGLPPDLDTTVFTGSELQEVCFTANTIHLAFDRDISVTLESSFSVDGVIQRIPVPASDLMAFAGCSVRAARASTDGTLALEFDNGRVIVCIDDSTQFESYQINMMGRKVVV